MTNNILLTGTERDEYIKAHFTPDTVVPDELMIESTVTPEEQSWFEDWYDAHTEETQALVDMISDRTYSIIDEDEYDEFIDELDDYGITNVSEFEDRFEGEFDGESELLAWVEELIDEMGYLNDVPAFVSNHIDYQAIWDCELRFDYSIIVYKGNTFLFHA